MIKKDLNEIINDFNLWFENHYFIPLTNDKNQIFKNLIYIYDCTNSSSSTIKNIILKIGTTLAYPSFYVKQKIQQNKNILSKYLTDNNVMHKVDHESISIDFNSFQPLLAKLKLEGVL